MVLVTGGAGLTGSELIRQLLAQGERVRAIYNTSLPAAAEGVELVQCDILDVVMLESVMKGIDEVYHCAGLVSFKKKDEQALYKINVEGTANVVNACLTAGIRKLVHVSSVAALGGIRKDTIINESMQWSPETSNSRYARSKYLGEMEVWRGVAEGLQAVIINPSIILGPGNWDNGSTSMFKTVYNGFPWYTEGITGFVDVKDVAKIMIMLMKSEITGEKFIVSAYNASYKFLFERIAEGFQKRAPYKKASPYMAGMVRRMEWLKSIVSKNDPLVTRETVATAFAIARFDNSKFLNCFPSFRYTSVEETISTTCKVLQQKVNNL